MSNLKPIFESFFKSDDETIELHKDNLIKESAIKHLNDGFSKIFSSIEKIQDGDVDKIDEIMESFRNMVPGLDYYQNENVKKTETLLAESIGEFSKKNAENDVVSLEYLTIKLQEAVESNGATILLNEEYENVDSIEQSLDEEEAIESEIDAMVPPQTDDGMVDSEDMTPTEQESAFEKGFNEGRKYFEEMRAQGLNPKNYARQLAETKYADRPFMEVETWMEGFSQGIKMQERVMREMKPELFESEND